MQPDRSSRLCRLSSIFSALIFVAIGWSSQRNLNILWDEAVDHDIAVGLARDPLHGEQPTLDASQTRLPMYVNAIVFRVFGRDDLPVSRGVSLFFGAVTILLCAELGQTLFSPIVGMLSGLLLAISPYFLAFGRIAMTEGDVFFACFATGAMLAFVRYLERPTRVRWVVTALLFGMALGAKLFAIYLIPVWAVMTIVQQSPESELKYSKWQRLAGIIVLGTIFCGVLLPVHILEPAILKEIIRRTIRWDHRMPLALWSDHLRLYAGIILIKLTVPLGILTSAALVYAGFVERNDPRWRPCILAIIFYVAGLCFLPLRQTFYLMGIYPFVIITLAAFIVQIHGLCKKMHPLLASGWNILVFTMLIQLMAGLYSAFPHLHLYGYDVVGNSWMGKESRGYRNLIQTPSDGVVELIEWCNQSPLVQPDDKVVSYLWEDRIINRELSHNRKYQFIPRGIRDESDAVPSPPDIIDAKFVLLHINNLLGYGDRPPDVPPSDLLNRDFEIAHAVRRGSMNIGWVYMHKPSSENQRKTVE